MLADIGVLSRTGGPRGAPLWFSEPAPGLLRQSSPLARFPPPPLKKSPERFANPPHPGYENRRAAPGSGELRSPTVVHRGGLCERGERPGAHGGLWLSPPPLGEGKKDQ